MHHVHAVHADEDLSAIEQPPEIQHPKIKADLDHNQNDAVKHAASMIPGSLRLRGSHRTMTPDWKTPVSGITTTSDHRRKFKINQVKTMKLVKNGEGEKIIFFNNR